MDAICMIKMDEIWQKGNEWEPAMAFAEELVTNAIEKGIFGLLTRKIDNFTVAAIIVPKQLKRKAETKAEPPKKKQKLEDQQPSEPTASCSKRRPSEEIKILFEKKMRMDI